MEIGQKRMALTNNKINILSHKKLSIQISLSGLSFCILQEDSNSISYLEYFEFDKKQTPFELLNSLKNVFDSKEELQGEFNSLIVIYENELSTLVPKPLFDEDNLADYLKFNSKILKSDFISFDEIQINDSVNVHVPYVNINNYIYEKFGAFTYTHYATVLIEHILNIDKNADEPKMYVNVSKAHFEIIITHLGKLLFYNSFEYTTKEDFIYYTLFTAEQLKLNPETLAVTLFGNVDANSELFDIAYKYIRNVSFGIRKDSFSIADETISDHSNYVLLNSF